MTGPYRSNNNNNNIDQKAKINNNQQQQQQHIANQQTTTRKKRIHDQFNDIMDYIMLDTMEREKHRLEVDRTHPVIEKFDNDNDNYNPTIGDIKKIKLR